MRRTAFGIADQLLYSLTNFALTVLVARSVSAADFGAYSLLAATYLLGVAVIRGLTSEPLVIRYSASDRSTWRQAARAAGGAALLAGLLLGALFIGGGIVEGVLGHAALGRIAIVFGILFPGLVVQDYARFAALALGRPVIALVNDAAMAVLQFATVGVLIAVGLESVPSLVGAWGGAAYVGAVLGLLMMRFRPSPARTVEWFKRDGDLATRYGVDDLAAQSSQQGTAYVVAVVGGLTQTGALRGAQTVFGPPSILNLGVQAAVMPELVRVLQDSLTRMRRHAIYVGAGLGLVGLLWGLAALAAPNWIGHALFGATWKHARPLLKYFVIAQVATGLRLTPIIGLRALGAANRTLRARVVAIVLALVLLLAGAVVDGARGVAIATAILTPLQAVIWWVEFEIAFREHRHERAIRRRDEQWQQLLESAPKSGSEFSVPWLFDALS